MTSLLEQIQGNWQYNSSANNGEKYIRELLDSSYQGVKDCLFLLMIIQQVINKFLLILPKQFFQDLKLKITILKLMVEVFMISQLMNIIKQYNEVKKKSTGQGDDYTNSNSTNFFYW